jgi:hypothetical protein
LWGVVALMCGLWGCEAAAPPPAPPDPVYKVITDPLAHFQAERLRWVVDTVPPLLAASADHGEAKMRCELARLTIDQMLDVGALSEVAAPLAAKVHTLCAVDLASRLLDGLVTSLADPALGADPATSPCQTTVAPVMVFIGDHPSADPEVRRKRDLVFEACPEFAEKFKAFEAKREAYIRSQQTPTP